MYVLEVFIPSFCGEGIHLLINRFLNSFHSIMMLLLIFLTLF